MGFIADLFTGGKKAAAATPTYTPVVAPTPTVVSTPATTADTSITTAATNTRQQSLAGLASTIKTSATGAAQAPVGYKSLLGQ